jgi:taurine dioxygenase
MSQLTPWFGASIDGIDINTPLSEREIDTLTALLREHRLLVLPGQRLTAEKHVAFVKGFGEVLDELDDGSGFSSVRNDPRPDGTPDDVQYHTDFGFSTHPLPIVTLYGVTIPTGAATTRCVDATRALARMPSDLTSRLRTTRVLHATDMQSASEGSAGRLAPEDVLRGDPRHWRGTVRPAIIEHPTTREQVLFINEYLSVLVVGEDADSSRALFAEVFAYLYDPAYTYEHKWRVGDLLLLDNISLQHSRSPGGMRVLRRVVVSDVPMAQLIPPVLTEADELYSELYSDAQRLGR